MPLSAPVFYLKRKARILSRKMDIPLHEALDRVAVEEGFSSWSMLAARTATAAADQSDGALLGRLVPGDLMLIGARPGQGKTMMGLRLALAAMRDGRPAAFFTLVYTGRDRSVLFRALGAKPSDFDKLFLFHDSDAINAHYMIDALAALPRGSVAVVDYLQALDHRRENPDLMVQVSALRQFARERGLILVFISQVDRAYEGSGRSLPDLQDVRLPNPLDLTLFDKTCFLNRGEMRFASNVG